MRLTAEQIRGKHVYGLQYRNRVSPHAAGEYWGDYLCVCKLQYRNRVSPMRQDYLVAYMKLLSGFNTAIGYHPMRLENMRTDPKPADALQYRNRVSSHAACGGAGGLTDRIGASIPQ